jgi:apyrase
MLQLVMLLLLLVIAFVGVLALHLYKAFQAPVHHTQHMVIMDAGSTGTRVHVFRYRAHPSSAYPVIHLPEAKLKLQPGLSSFADNPAGAEEPLKNLLEYAAAHVPSDEWQATPVFLMATAGLRLLPAEQADALLAQCRGVLARSPFRFDHSWVTIITGQEEGLYGWVAANYAAGSLQVSPDGRDDHTAHGAAVLCVQPGAHTLNAQATPA